MKLYQLDIFNSVYNCEYIDMSKDQSQPILDSININPKDQDETEEDIKMKNKLLTYHNKNSVNNGRIDINKVVEEYQKKFHVPKTLIIKWLDLKVQKSLFNKPCDQSNLSESCISQDTSVMDNESALSGSCSLSIKDFSSKTIEELAENKKVNKPRSSFRKKDSPLPCKNSPNLDTSVIPERDGIEEESPLDPKFTINSRNPENSLKKFTF